MTATKWTIDTDHSDVLINAKRTVNAYLFSKISTFSGSIAIKEDELEDASVSFVLKMDNKGNKLTDALLDHNPLTIAFKSTSFQKINSNINFLKGNLTINNITKMVELDAVLTGLETQNGVSTAVFEIIGTINRKDFQLSNHSFSAASGGLNIGQNINLTANLEFKNHSMFNPILNN